MSDPLAELVYAHPELADLDPDARRCAIEDLLREVGVEDAAATADRLFRMTDGFGPLTDLLEDDAVTDVLVNGLDVWVERSGALERTNLALSSEDLDALIDRLVGAGGGRLDAMHPITDVRLAGGARMHLVARPIAVDGPIVSIRSFGRSARSIDDLVESRALSRSQAESLVQLVEARSSIAISGATGVGKTTLLGALLMLIPETERVVIIEETPELPSPLPHGVRLTPRSSNVEGRGAVTSGELVRSALRMRPDRIVIGEVRGTEAADALWAMSTGHAGSMLTVHARGPRHVPTVLAGLAAGAPSSATDGLIGRFADAIDVFVHLERIGTRRVVTGIVAG